MEQHPVPQNVTTFQFRLIGDMTLKQFGYLCGGAILAFVAYKLPMPFIITWPLTMAFAFLGIGFAFIPIEERPMDVWVFSFFKSVYSPTQYLWSRDAPSAKAKVVSPQPPPQKPTPSVPIAAAAPVTATPVTAAPVPIAAPSISPTVPVTVPEVAGKGHPIPPPLPTDVPKIITPRPEPQQAKAAVLSGLFQSSPVAAPPPTSPPSVHSHVVSKHHGTSLFAQFWAWLFPKPPISIPNTHPLQGTKPVIQTHAVPIPSVTGLHTPVATPSTPVLQTVTESSKPLIDPLAHEKMARMEVNIANLEAKLKTSTSAEDRVLELQKQLTELLEQKTKTDDELASIKRSMLTKPEPSAPPTPGTPTKTGSVNVITTQEGAIKAGLPRLTSFPNVITGRVKDDEGNLLPGILVTVTNTDGVPMRALKTNKLGQFAASTPLASGTYYVEIEDPRARFTFSRVQITLSGGVVPILEILAKSEKVLAREKLTKEIFGSPNS